MKQLGVTCVVGVVGRASDVRCRSTALTRAEPVAGRLGRAGGRRDAARRRGTAPRRAVCGVLRFSDNRHETSLIGPAKVLSGVKVWDYLHFSSLTHGDGCRQKHLWFIARQRNRTGTGRTYLALAARHHQSGRQAPTRHRRRRQPRALRPAQTSEPRAAAPPPPPCLRQKQAGSAFGQLAL